MLRDKSYNFNLKCVMTLLMATCLMAPSFNSACAQEAKPITKHTILRALARGRTHRNEANVSRMIELIQGQKVAFQMTPADEREIRQAGTYLVKNELNQLIDALRKNYSPKSSVANGLPLSSIGLNNKDLYDSSGDSALDGKIRLIHASINNTLRLRTNYKFYDDSSAPNVFFVEAVEGSYPDGTLIIGKKYVGELNIPSTTGTALATDAVLYLIIAHELSHAVQLQRGLPFKGKQQELHADFLGGWGVARFLRSTKDYSKEYENTYLKVLNFAFSVGDSSYSEESYNGTPKERFEAVGAGFELKNEDNPDEVYKKGIEYVTRRFKETP